MEQSSTEFKYFTNKEVASYIFASIMGVGILFIPNVWSNSGQEFALIEFIFSFFMVFTSLYFLLDVAEDNIENRVNQEMNKNIESQDLTNIRKNDIYYNERRKTTYALLCESIDKKYAPNILSFSIAFACYASTILYFITMCGFAENILSIFPLLKITIGKYGIKTLISFIFMIPLAITNTQIKNDSALGKLSILSVIGAVFLTVFLFALNFIADSNFGIDKKKSPSLSPIISFILIISSFPTLMFALACQQNIITAYARMKERNFNKICISFSSSIILAGILYLIVGISGYYIFKNIENTTFLHILTNSSKIKDLIPNDTARNVVSIFSYICVGLFSTILVVAFIIQTFSARFSLLLLLRKKFKVNEANFKLIATIIQGIICVSLFIAEIQPTFILSFSSSIFMSILCFIIPSILYCKSNYKKNNEGKAIFGLIILVISCIILLVCPISVVLDVFKNTFIDKANNSTMQPFNNSTTLITATIPSIISNSSLV